MLDTAIEAAQIGGQIALSYFKKIPKITYKPDKSPVTEADIKAEKAIRKLISKKFPDHGLIGEELGKTNPKAKYQWTIDPIDGTKSFVRGIKDWGTLIAVLENDKPIIGVYLSPATDELFYCQKKKGTFLNNKRTYVSKVKNIETSFIVHSSLNHFLSPNRIKQLVTLSKTVQGKKSAADCSGINLLLKGQVDANLSGHGSIWDYAPSAILTEEAGGKFSDFNNKFSLTNDTGLFTNGLVHNQVLKILNN